MSEKEKKHDHDEHKYDVILTASFTEKSFSVPFHRLVI